MVNYFFNLEQLICYKLESDDHCAIWQFYLLNIFIFIKGCLMIQILAEGVCFLRVSMPRLMDSPISTLAGVEKTMISIRGKMAHA